MPTIVGILTFISRINTTPQSFKAIQSLILIVFFLLVVVMSCLIELSIKQVLYSRSQATYICTARLKSMASTANIACVYVHRNKMV